MSNEIPAAAIGNVNAADDWPKASIGNYKGVMLCLRPDGNGNKRKPISENIPFNTRVHKKEPLGWNPCQKLVPKPQKKKDRNHVLQKHRNFLNKLEQQKNEAREAQ